MNVTHTLRIGYTDGTDTRVNKLTYLGALELASETVQAVDAGTLKNAVDISIIRDDTNSVLLHHTF